MRQLNVREAGERWNAAIHLHYPTVGELVTVVGGEVANIFEDVPDFLYLGGNLGFKVPPDGGSHPEEPVLSVMLVLRDHFFEDALVETADLGPFRFLGRQVPCSAQQMLDHLSAVDNKHLSTATESDRWTIYYGGALSLLFLPSAGPVPGPAASTLQLAEFFYSRPFTGSIRPEVHWV